MKKLTNLQKVHEIIAFECINKGNVKGKDLALLKQYTILATHSYVLVQWPFSQDYMEKVWFKKEAILDVEGKFGSGAYFIPLKRLL